MFNERKWEIEILISWRFYKFISKDINNEEFEDTMFRF